MEMKDRVSENRISSAEERDAQSKESMSTAISQRMTIAGGFLDIALFVADVEHLKFIFDTGRDDIQYYDLLLGLLFSSLILQVLVGVLLFVVGFGKDLQTKQEAYWTKVLNHIIIGLVSVIALVNIFVTVFGDRGEAITQYKTKHQCYLNLDPNEGTNTSSLFR